ncbi:hypothetical protein [Nonomuraea sp. B5E05]|uniref:hypothetical protein n=1 Tax=Nonomuraea sp. B5E05 TaxID=3153569 RepID=UPI0032610734
MDVLYVLDVGSVYHVRGAPAGRPSRLDVASDMEVSGQLARSAMDLRFSPLLVADVQAMLEKHGYRLPSGGGHARDLVMDRVNLALKNLVEIFEGRTA